MLVEVVVDIEANSASDAEDLLEDYLGDLGPDVHIKINKVAHDD
jgi:hypothetical protein